MNFLVVVGLLSFLASCLADMQRASPQMESQQGMMRIFENLKAAPAAKKSLRTEQAVGNVRGAFMSVAVYTGDTCAGNSIDTLYNSGYGGACVAVRTNKGEIKLYVKAICYTDTGMSTSTFYHATDSTCTGPTAGPPEDDQDGVCDKGVLVNCHADLLFAQKGYSDLQSAETDNIMNAVYIQIGPVVNEIVPIASEQRQECDMSLVPGDRSCVDTTHRRSMAYVAKNFTSGTLNLYSKYEGEGTVWSKEYTNTVLANHESVINVKNAYLLRNWVDDHTGP